MHGQNPPKASNQLKSQGGRDVKQMMRANVAEETFEELKGAFSVTTSFTITDITDNTRIKDPSKHVEVYDSGASCHMSPYINAFTDFTFIEPKPISAANNHTFEAVGKGSMQILIPNGDKSTVVHLCDVLYTPAIAFTLISLSQADSAGYLTVIKDSNLHLLDHNRGKKIIGRIPAKNGLWSITQSTKALENGQVLLPGCNALSAISLMDLH